MKTIFTLILLFSFQWVIAQTAEYTYIDGNGNKYEITGNQMHYVPVKKENSSSGEYSGGEPGEYELNSDDTKKLKKLLSDAMKATDDHHTDREMGTGLIIHLNKKNKEKMVILKMDSKSKNDIETFLKSLTSK